ncbi:non-ribosomal peptide synthetase [Pseudomonas anguilliseptica]|uniref:Amino acid adenylation domain-containing protein n=1 Tax=Pseudomonas anguilliseptica TaxID=53406 RepID=A0A1H5I3C4_PSEAG|nr:non-ribosomal peptide synthetase [Pseudomonas anguilliseptica]SEE34391.1 amino acid adenylation domain-containing protein [Pseudomonas anguilliseptica]
MSTNIIGLLNQLARQGVQLSLNAQGQLVSQSSKDAITPELGQQIRANRDAIITCLAAANAFAAPIQAQHAESGPLSSSQSGLWFIEQYEESSHLYNMPVYFRLSGELDVPALAFAFDALAQRHGSLRTRFVRNAEGRGEQQILLQRPLQLDVEDLSALEFPAREAQVAQRVREEINRPFDLTTGELTRVHLLRLGAREHVLLITQHHIISDGWSVKNMFADLKTAFLAFQNRQPLNWQAPALNYIDYASWFNSPLFRDYHEQFKPFWVERLRGIADVHSLPLDKPRPAHQASGGELVFSTIDNALWERFKQLCQQHNTSPFIGLHAVFALLLARHGGERDIVIGTPLAYRERPDIEGLVGFFVNTLVLRTQLPERQSFSDYLQACRKDDLEAFDHQLYRFEALSEALGMDRHTAINPIFQIMLVYQARVDFNDLIPGCQAVEETSPVLPAKTDISVKVTELMDSVRVDWLYATALFEHATIERYAERLLLLLEAVVEQPEMDIWALPLLDQPLVQQTAARLAALPREYPNRRTALGLFEDMARLHPQRPALGVGHSAVSYAELDARANRLAHWLLSQGCGPGALLGVLARRENAFAVAVMAIWKINAAYVPLDPAYPRERLQHILGDAGIELIVGQGEPPFALNTGVRWVDLQDASLQAQLDGMLPTTPALGHDPQQLAQVIYTSGSSGLPKGVMVEQGSLVNLLQDHAQRLQLSCEARMFNCMSLSFDAGNMCALLPLTQGASLVWGEPDEDLVEQIERSASSHMIFPTALLATLPDSALPTVQAIGFGGEACPAGLVERWAGRVRLINMYGPTETTVTALCKHLEPGSSLSIGSPIDGMQALILDELGNLCPVGVPGELCLAGLGLARGYLNQPERTAAVFREHCVAGVTLRLYHSGDRARLLGNGDYEYLGRLDEQIKLRGYRIEPGEIETQLSLSCPELQQVKVLVLRDGQRQALVAYAALKPGAAQPAVEAILHDVAQRLPEYMVPSSLVLLEQMPLTPNGKLDLRQLPKIDLAAGGEHTPPANPLEAEILAIWQAVLNQPLGVQSDFFQLGGDSILSIQLTTRLRDAGYACSVKEVFEAKTVRRLCRVLGSKRKDIAVQAEQGVLIGEFPLQPIQRWFYEQPLATPQHWNQGVLLRLPEDVGAPQLRSYLQQLLQHHDALRLAVTESGQRYLENLPLGSPALLDYRELGETGLQLALTKLQSHFEPMLGRTLCWGLVENLPQGRALFIACHHLVVDAVSWRILADDLARLHRGEALPAKTSSYRQWGQGLTAYVLQAGAQLRFWRERMAAMDYRIAPEWVSAEPTQVHLLELEPVLTQQLSQHATQVFAREMRSLLLAALNRTLSEMGLGQRQWILLEGHGREAIDPSLDVSRTLGWFTSMYPLVLDDQADWAQLIAQCAEQLRQVPDNGVGYMPLRASLTEPNPLPLPPVALNYLGSARSGQGDWQPLPIAPGRPSAADNRSAELISLHGGIFDGRLTLRQIGCLRGDLSEQLLQRLRQHLGELARLAMEVQQ